MSDLAEAVYRLTVAERNAAWMEAARYREALRRVAEYTLDLTAPDGDGQAAAAFWIVQKIAQEALQTPLAPPEAADVD